MDQSKKIYILIWMILSVFLLIAFSQEDPPLSKEDKNKLEKISILKQNAQELLNNADSIYSYLAGYNTSDFQNSKKIKKLNSKAANLKLKALILKEEAYLLEQSINKNSIPQSKLDYSNNNDSTLKFNTLVEKPGELSNKGKNDKIEVNELDKNTSDIQLFDEEIHFEDLNEILQTDEHSLITQKDENQESENKELSKEIIFKVQIAADRVKLSSEKLQSIYRGHKKIEMFEKDNWYKYCVGEFQTFYKANEYRVNCGVGDAFIIAFQGENPIDILTAKGIKKNCNQ